MGDPITRERALELKGTDTPVYPHTGPFRHQPCLVVGVTRIDRRDRVCIEHNGEKEWRSADTVSSMAGDLVFQAFVPGKGDSLMIRRECWLGRPDDLVIYFNGERTGDVYQWPNPAYDKLRELGWDGTTNADNVESSLSR